MPAEDVEATIQRISNYKGVLGCIILARDGQVIKTTCEAPVTEQHAHLIPPLAALAGNMVRDLDPQNHLEFLRIRSHKHEIMVSPSAEFTLIVVQTPSTESS